MPVDPDRYVPINVTGDMGNAGPRGDDGEPQDNFDDPDNSGLGLILGVF